MNNSIQTRILNKNKSFFLASCSCHLAYLASGTGGRAFQKVSNFDVEDHQVDIYTIISKGVPNKRVF